MTENGISNNMDFQSYRNLSSEQQQFFIFDTLCRIDERTANIDSQYARRWVETVVKSTIGVTLVGVLGAVLSTVGIHIKGS